jgi:hypothetical protein
MPEPTQEQESYESCSRVLLLASSATGAVIGQVVVATVDLE